MNKNTNYRIGLIKMTDFKSLTEKIMNYIKTLPKAKIAIAAGGCVVAGVFIHSALKANKANEELERQHKKVDAVFSDIIAVLSVNDPEFALKAISIRMEFVKHGDIARYTRDSIEFINHLSEIYNMNVIINFEDVMVDEDKDTETEKVKDKATKSDKDKATKTEKSKVDEAIDDLVEKSNSVVKSFKKTASSVGQVVKEALSSNKEENEAIMADLIESISDEEIQNAIDEVGEELMQAQMKDSLYVNEDTNLKELEETIKEVHNTLTTKSVSMLNRMNKSDLVELVINTNTFYNHVVDEQIFEGVVELSDLTKEALLKIITDSTTDITERKLFDVVDFIIE